MGFLQGIKEVVPFLSPDYPVDIWLAKRRGDSHVWVKDKGRRISKKTDEGEKYELKKQKKETAPVSFDAINVTSGGRNLLFLLEEESGEYISLNMDPDEETIRELAERKSSQAYRYNRYNAARTLYRPKGLLEQWKNELSLLMFGVFLILLGVAFSKAMQGWTGQMNTAASTFLEAAQTMAG